MARKINAVSPNESRLNEFFADPERRNTSNFRGISYEDERRAHANEIYESGTKWVNEQLESGGGSGGGGAQPDWNAAEGEPGHILNRTHCMEKRTGSVLDSGALLRISEGAYVALNYPVELITGEKYTVTYNNGQWECEALFVPSGEPGSGIWVLGNMGAVTGEGDSGEPFVCLVSTGVSSSPLEMFSNVQVMDLTGNNDLRSIIIVGPHYRRERLGKEWLQLPYSYCMSASLIEAENLPFSSVKPFLAYGGELSIRIYDSSASNAYNGVLLRCTEHDSEKAVFENMQIKNGTIVVSRLTAYADGTPTEYTTESYGLTAK